jgi:hypothetical protein
MRYEYSKDVMIIDGKEYSLKPYRKWLMEYHEGLCRGHFVKALKVDGYTKAYFDWQTIYHLASEYGFLNNYLKTI